MKTIWTMAGIFAVALMAAAPAGAQENNGAPAPGREDIPSVTKEVQMPPNASPESNASLNAGREEAKKHRRVRHVRPEQQQEIRDHSTGLENRVDAGEGAMGDAALAAPAAMGSGARMSTPFNR